MIPLYYSIFIRIFSPLDPLREVHKKPEGAVEHIRSKPAPRRVPSPNNPITTLTAPIFWGDCSMCGSVNNISIPNIWWLVGHHQLFSFLQGLIFECILVLADLIGRLSCWAAAPPLTGGGVPSAAKKRLFTFVWQQLTFLICDCDWNDLSQRNLDGRHRFLHNPGRTTSSSSSQEDWKAKKAEVCHEMKCGTKYAQVETFWTNKR